MIDYLYSISQKDYKNFVLVKDEFPYFPLIYEEDIFSLLDSNFYVIINKKFYSYINVKNIITNKNQIYNILINKFNFCLIENLYFIEYEFNKIFNNPLSFKILIEKKIYKCFPKIENYSIINFKVPINNILKENENKVLLELKENNKEEVIEEKIIKKIEKIEMKIPILWIPCNKLLSNIEEEDITKKFLINHYFNCTKCEINNNNSKELLFDKKILFKISDNLIEYKNLIQYYQIGQNLNISQKKFDKYEFNKDKLNFIFININEETDILYNNCIFILT